MLNTRTYALFLVLTGLLVYAMVVFNGFVADDFLQIVYNTKIHSLSNIPQLFFGSTYDSGGADRLAGIFYRPVMLIFFSLLHALFGLNPAIYHLFQLLLHIANALLLFFFLRRFFPESISFVSSLIFLVHPINTEAVVFIADFQEVLFFFFGISALLLITQKKPTRRTYFFSSVLFLLSLLSKETGVLFLFISLFLNYFYYKRREILFFLLVGMAFSLYLVLRYGIAHLHLAEKAVAPIASAPFLVRMMNLPLIDFYYISTFLFPKDLISNQFWIIRETTVQDFVVPLVFSVVVFGIIGFLGYRIYRKKQLFPLFLLFSFWLLIGLGLHMQFYPLDATVADRWFYSPIVGFIGIGAIFYMQYGKKIPRKLTLVTCVVIVLLLGIRTIVRVPNWKDGLTLTTHDIKIVRKNFLMDNIHATELITAGRYKEAKPFVLSSVSEYPYYANLNNLAIVYTAEKNKKMAKKYLWEAVQHSQHYKIYENYANFLLVYDNEKEARDFSQKALKVFPKNAALWRIFAQSSYLLKDYKKAKEAAKMAYALLPTQENSEIYLLLSQNKKIVVPQQKLE